MNVVHAQIEDIPAWLALAAEVEPLFGPMVNEPGFHEALGRNIDRKSAFCVREDDGPAGAPLLGGILFSCRQASQYEVGWLAVAAAARRCGVGSLLLRHVLGRVRPPGEVMVETFRDEAPGGLPARLFYERHGFCAAELGEAHGHPVQVFRLRVE